MKFFVGALVLALAMRSLGGVQEVPLERLTPYGVCAHVTRSELRPDRLEGTIRAMKFAGIGYVRSDIDAWRVRTKTGGFDFSIYDRLLDQLDANGIKLLPIIYSHGKPPADWKAPADWEAYRAFIRAFARHYGRRMSVYEIWNEPNGNGFFKGADPKCYAKVLQCAYQIIKEVDPGIRVAFAGVSGVPIDWIRAVLASGAAQSFDIMNVHPYTHPSPPERDFESRLTRLKKLMKEFHCEQKPIWITEMGWPTHEMKIANRSLIQAGLRVARPDQKTWRVVLANTATEGVLDQRFAETFCAILPAGSTVKECSQEETIALLKGDTVDAVVYPLDETFPADTIDAVSAFITKGGVFLDLGGMPCYFGQRNGLPVEGMQGGSQITRFPFGSRAWWIDPKYPKETQTFATPVGLAAGVKQEPTGFKTERFLVPDRIGPESEWIPLVASKTKDGTDLVSVAVIRYKGERKGAAILGSLFNHCLGTNNEENQARYTARALAMAFAQGVEAFFPYNLRSQGMDPYYSENHFGLMQANFAPKPAYSAYMTFIQQRPEGSIQTRGAWHDEKGEVFFPQWMRPDGTKVGMLWKLGDNEKRAVSFTGENVTFYRRTGRKTDFPFVSNGVWKVEISGDPIYFEGAALKGTP